MSEAPSIDSCTIGVCEGCGDEIRADQGILITESRGVLHDDYQCLKKYVGAEAYLIMLSRRDNSNEITKANA